MVLAEWSGNDGVASRKMFGVLRSSSDSLAVKNSCVDDSDVLATTTGASSVSMGLSEAPSASVTGEVSRRVASVTTSFVIAGPGATMASRSAKLFAFDASTEIGGVSIAVSST